MRESKYGKYFKEGLAPKEEDKFAIRLLMDDDIIKGSSFFSYKVYVPSKPPREHPAHTHESGEILGWFGLNPEDPFDLGAEVEICMGEEMEKHVFSRSTILFIPARLVHCPIKYNRVDKPFSLVQVVLAPKTNEKPYP